MKTLFFTLILGIVINPAFAMEPEGNRKKPSTAKLSLISPLSYDGSNEDFNMKVESLEKNQNQLFHTKSTNKLYLDIHEAEKYFDETYLDSSSRNTHPKIDLQNINPLSKEQLQELYKTGHILLEEGCYHVGRWNVDRGGAHHNYDMELLSRILKKQFENGDGWCFSDEPRTIHYSLSRSENDPCFTLCGGASFSTFYLAQKLQVDSKANEKPDF